MPQFQFNITILPEASIIKEELMGRCPGVSEILLASKIFNTAEECVLQCTSALEQLAKQEMVITDNELVICSHEETDFTDDDEISWDVFTHSFFSVSQTFSPEFSIYGTVNYVPSMSNASLKH